MFQNVSKNTREVFDEDVEFKNTNVEGSLKKDIVKQTFNLKNCIIYALSFMMSMAGGDSSLLSMAPFGLAMIAATVGTEIPILMVAIACLLGTAIKFGGSYILTYILTILVFFAAILIKRPKMSLEQFEVNEKKSVGGQLVFSVLVVQLLQMFFKTFYVYDLLYGVMLTISSFVLYKIFVNGLAVYKGLGNKKVYSIEEVIGASLIAIIAFSALGNLNIFGFSVRNILSILVVLMLGWKNGMLVGATGGLTIGLTLGIIQGENPAFIAAYAISGLVAGILNKLGKVGVIAGFVIGNIILSYISNGNTVEIIRFQEILIAALGLLAMPKSAGIKVSDLTDEYKLLPETTGRTLEENKATINKLNNMSDTISQIAREYEEAAATIVTDEDIEKQEKINSEMFINELRTNLEGQEENLLYDDIYNDEENILEEIFKILLDKEVITKKDIISIFANHNNYIMGYSNDEDTNDYMIKQDIDDMVRIINSSYRISKINFIWKKKLKENRKSVSTQLSGVSEAISNLAEQITIEEDDKYKEKKEEIKALLKEKEIILKEIVIKQEESNRYIVSVYTDSCDSLDGKQCHLKKITRILEKVLKEKMVLQKQKCALRENDKTCMFSFASEDKYTMQVGIAKSKKFGSVISGDTTIQTRLEDGKFLLAISDGMGSGPDARKSSKIAIKMLERLLETGFNKDIALKLINSIISNNTDDDMYATLDVNILDLYKGNMEFFKNGACPTFIKRNGKVDVLKSVSLPTGILDNIDLIEYNQDLKDGDIIVMCSDGIIDSSNVYSNKELWVKELLEELETDDSQRIADIILNESRDNDFGKEKDDMTVICCRINKKN